MNINQPECSDSLYNDKKEHIDETKLEFPFPHVSEVLKCAIMTGWITAIMAFVSAFLVLGKKPMPEPYLSIWILSSIVCAVCGIVALISYVRYISRKVDRVKHLLWQEVDQPSIDKIPSGEQFITDIAIMAFDKYKGTPLNRVEGFGDLVLGKKSLFFIYSEQLPMSDGQALLTGFASAGLLGAFVMSKMQKSDMKNLLLRMQEKRSKESSLSLRQRLVNSSKSFVIPVIYITNIRVQDGWLYLQYAFESKAFALDEVQLSKLKAWLRQVRQEMGLILEDRPSLSESALVKWILRPKSSPSEKVIEEMSQLDSRPYLIASLARTLTLGTCRALRRVLDVHEVIDKIRIQGLNYVVDKNVNLLLLPAICFLFTPFIIGFGLSIEGEGDLPPIAICFALIGSIAAFIMLVTPPVILTSLWIAKFEVKRIS